jgi:hypothetical protein
MKKNNSQLHPIFRNICNNFVKPTEKYYSICCQAYMNDYPTIDICPKCGEHTGGFTQEEIKKEEGNNGRLLK